jgi:hypothetical protein
MAMDLLNCGRHRKEAIKESAHFLCKRVGWVNCVAESASFHRLLVQKSETKSSVQITTFGVSTVLFAYIS